MTEFSRLETLLFRLEAQHACLAWAFNEVKARPGPVFELGLGHGRTFDHLRRNLPGRDIYVFDREIDSFEDCVPQGKFMVLGDLGETLPRAAQDFSRQVVLAHCDLGTYRADYNEQVRRLVSAHLAPVLAPGAIVLSDLPLAIAKARALPLPSKARGGSYFVYRFFG